MPERDFYSYRWRPGGSCVGESRDGYWKRREERRKKLRKQYQQKLQKEALARRLAQERYNAEVSAGNALRSRLLSSGRCAGDVGEVSPGAIDYEADVTARTMLSSLFRK